ncbi:prefoldin subunit alpha [Candidatus Micrarchaeota archaeon]|nr:prefoldin subunit alpha [Candidatus Micrarchaeota archaeon]
MKFEEEIRKKNAEINYLRAQAGEIQRQIMAMNEAKNQLNAAIEALENTKEMKKGVLLPLGPAVFGKAILEKENEVLIDVGAQTFIQKTPEEAGKTMQERIRMIEANLMELQKAYIAGAEMAEKLNEEAEELVAKIRPE